MEYGFWSHCDQVFLQSTSEKYYHILPTPPPRALWQQLDNNGSLPDTIKIREVDREDRASEIF